MRRRICSTKASTYLGLPSGRLRAQEAVEGWAIGCDQVGRLLKILGIQEVLRRTAICTTQSHPGDPRFAEHCKRAWDSVTHPNQ